MSQQNNTVVKRTGANNLGAWGWVTTLCLFLLFFLGTAITSGFLNVSVSALSEKNGWMDAVIQVMPVIKTIRQNR